MQRLTSYINQVYAIADLRNLARENPIPVRYQLENGEILIVVVSHMEPNNVTLPFNVLWIVADPESVDFMKMFRRISAFPEGLYRNTWQQIHTMEQALIEAQYWDLSDGLVIGEAEVPQVGAATVDVRGLIKLNREYPTDPSRPVVVETADPRNSDARPPASHEHPLQPVTIMHGAGGIEEYLVKIATINDPVAGDVLVQTTVDQDGNAVALWRKPALSDLIYSGPMLTHLVIKGPAGDEIDELQPFTFRADAHYDDGSVLVDAPVQWLITGGNTEVATIGAVSGNFISTDVTQTETVRVQAAFAQAESGIIKTEHVDISIHDVTEYLELERIEVIGLTEVDENTSSSYSVQAYFTDGTNAGVTPLTFSSSNPSAGQFNSSTGVLVVGELAQDHTTTIAATFEYRGVTKSATLDVVAKDLTIYPESVQIIGPTEVDENTEVNYTLRVTFTNGTQQDFTDSDWESSNELAGVIATNGVFTAAEELGEDIATTISASYTLEGRTKYATLNVTVKDRTIYPRTARIEGADTVPEGSSRQYQLIVTFSDGTEHAVTARTWSFSTSAAGEIDMSGRFTAVADVDEDISGTLEATYRSEGVTVSAEKVLTVTDETDYPIGATIEGPAIVSEGDTAVYKLRVHFQSGASSIEHVETWASSAPSVATINRVTGALTAAPNLLEDGTTTITATFSQDGRTVEGELVVTVRDTTNYPVSAIIDGPNTVDEASQADYALIVTFADGTSAQRSAQWTVNGIGTINSNGRYTAPENVDENTVTHLNASYTLDGVTINAPAKAVTVIDTTVYPVSAQIIGPSQVTEGNSQNYQLEVLFSNNNRTVVNVTNWSSSNTDAATISSAGVLHAKDVQGTQSTEISASYTSEGRTVGDAITVNIMDSTDYPVSARIVGPAQIEEGDQTTFTLEVTYTSGAKGNVDVTNWSSSNPAAGNLNANTGIFTAVGNLQADVTTTITANYTAHGETVYGVHELTVKDVTVYPVSAVVEGDTLVDSLGTKQYQLRVTFEDQTNRVVDDVVWTHSNGDAGSIDSEGLFTASENVSGVNVATVVKGVWSLDGVEVEAVKSIAVRDLTNYPVSLKVNGVSTIDSSDENGASATQFTAEVTYVDGTKATVAAETWTVAGANQSDNIGTIDSFGNFTSNPDMSGSNRNITVRATYIEHGRTVTGQKTVAVTVVPRPVSMEIIGPSQLAADNQYTFQARVIDSVGAESIVDAEFSINVESPIAQMTVSGVVQTKRIGADTDAVVSATYTFNGKTVTATKEINISKIVEFDRIEITSDSEVESEGTNQLTVTAFFDNGTSLDVTQSVTYAVLTGVGQFSSTVKGLYSANVVTEDGEVVVEVAYKYDNITHRKTFTFAVIAAEVEPEPPAGDAMPRYGVAMFSDIDFTGGKGDMHWITGGPYDRWSGPQDFFDSVMTSVHDVEADNHFIVPTMDYHQFLYYAIPKSMTDKKAQYQLDSQSTAGGMDGIRYDEDDMPSSDLTPIEVVVDVHDGNGPQAWLVYRSDYPLMPQMNGDPEGLTVHIIK